MTRRPKEMPDWNLVASAREGEFVSAIRLLEEWGPVSRTRYYNVLVAKVGDPAAFAEEFRTRVEAEPEVLGPVARAVPAHRAFTFRDPAEFEDRARETALGWAPELAGKSFHVRMHRRGFKKKLSSQIEEQFLDGAILEELERRGAPGLITFDDPDAILAVETVGSRAGLSLWTRQELERYPFLGLD